MYESAAPISGRLFLFSDSRDVKRLWSAEIHLRFQVAREFYTQLCLATRTSKGARRVVSTGLAACGWLRGTSRTSPGPPRRWRRPVRLRSTPARGRGFAAYLPGCARQLLTVRCAHYAEGASLTTFGFVTIVPRYLPKASNSLTFVRGADRACCAPRKWPCSLIYVPHKWPCGLICAPCKWRFCLITRRANGDSALSINPVSRILRSKKLDTVPGAGTLPVWGSGG